MRIELIGSLLLIKLYIQALLTNIMNISMVICSIEQFVLNPKYMMCLISKGMQLLIIQGKRFHILESLNINILNSLAMILIGLGKQS